MSLVGGVLILAGVAALVLPGPGLLLILVGLVVLATEFEWAAARVEWMQVKALRAAAEGVSTWPRIAASTLSAFVVMAAGVVWGLDPTVPEVWVFGPSLPFAGWATGVAVVAGGVIALVLLGYSVRRFRWGATAAAGGLAPGEAPQEV